MMRNRAVLRDSYHAATIDELRKNHAIRRTAAFVDQRVLFPHRGQIELSGESLTLVSWRTLAPGDVFNVSMDFLPEYSRVAAGGSRGGFPSFGVLKRLGAPLVLDLTTGERIALLIGYTWWSGTTKDTAWLPELEAFAARSD
jgi:hypothetical protein